MTLGRTWLAALVAVMLPAAGLAGDLTALVSVPPQADLLQRIAGDRVAIRVLVGPGESPATYDPTPRELARVSDAQVWFRAGVPMENALVRRVASLLPAGEVVDLREGLDLLPAGDDHGHDHDHGETDPHLWLSPRLCAVQAERMALTLTRLDPGHADAYAAGLAALRDTLSAVDHELRALLAPVRGDTMLVFHPAFGYLAHDYGLVQVAVEAGGLAPSPRHLARVLQDARERGARAIFVQPQFSEQSARIVAREAGLEVVVLDPLARDHIANLRRIGHAIRDALGGGS